MNQPVYSQVGQIVDNPSAQPGVLLIGLGNPILGDDGVGWRIVEEVERQIWAAVPDLPFADHQLKLQIDYLSLGGLSLMEHMLGYTYAVLVDSIVTGEHPLGTVQRFKLDELPSNAVGHLASAHDVSLQDAVEIGLKLGARLPEIITIIAIESHLVYDFSENLSPPVEAGIPNAVSAVIDCLREIPSASTK